MISASGYDYDDQIFRGYQLLKAHSKNTAQLAKNQYKRVMAIIDHHFVLNYLQQFYKKLFYVKESYLRYNKQCDVDSSRFYAAYVIEALQHIYLNDIIHCDLKHYFVVSYSC